MSAYPVQLPSTRCSPSPSVVRHFMIRGKGLSLTQRPASRHLAGATPRSSPPNGCLPFAKISHLFSRPCLIISPYWSSSKHGGATMLYKRTFVHQLLACIHIARFTKLFTFQCLCSVCFVSPFEMLALQLMRNDLGALSLSLTLLPR